ncbi:hypothetical protein CWATWH0005_4922 [Crocosphaera watsonii WH 0005]|uniref:Uncharacterized protein n=1 Tax=Crocosphaera watsonii WH 0005 TaxID=423472 RepID=T2IY20_CROWT|nr:hypothetical protein CWATWH0005_4922 [Crocosphaera watsonii WH 0005]
MGDGGMGGRGDWEYFSLMFNKDINFHTLNNLSEIVYHRS